MRRSYFAVGLALALFGCDSGDWACIERGDTMFSQNLQTGEIGSAGKGCSCEEMADFERRKFGRVDYGGLESDFGCKSD